MALFNKSALREKDTLNLDDKIFVFDANSKQSNAGNETISVANLLTYLEDNIDDVVGNLDITGVLTVADTTDSTSKDTGCVILEGGMGVEKSIFAGLTVNAGTSATVGTTLNVGTNQTFTKEVNHQIKVTATTTAATVGGSLSIFSGDGNTSGAGGPLGLFSGDGGLTGNGGLIDILTAAGGATSGNSGAITIRTGASTNGTTGSVAITTGAALGAAAGNITLNPGTTDSTTVSAITEISKGLVRKPLSSTVATGATATGKQVVDGLITVTGATGNIQLPTAAQITTALGSSPAGTNIELVVNCEGMTATNTATILVGANTTVASAPAITGGGTLTISQSTQVTAGFKLVYNTATTIKIYRIW